MNADALWGPACPGYGRPVAAFSSRESDGWLFVRSEDATSRARSATKQNLAREAKARYISCCAMATHVALPPTFFLGKRNSLRAEGFGFWKNSGP